jgi:hypothetical protein
VATIPPHREPGDVGHVDDHDDISDVLTDHQSRLVSVEDEVGALSSGGVTSVNGEVGVVSLDAGDVGALALTARAAVNGVASLDGTGKVPTAQLPASGGGGAVDSVNTQTGDVVLVATDVGALPLVGGTLSGSLTVSTGSITGVGASSTASGLALKVSGDAQPRLGVNSSGKILWGTGSIAGDTNLYRTNSNELTTDGALIAGVLAQTPIVQGGTTSAGNLTLRSTSHATRGKLLIGTSAYDEANNRLGVGTVTPAVPVDVVGQISATTVVQVPVVQGSASSAGSLTLKSTSHATKGKILFGTSGYDEVNNRLGIGNSIPTVPLEVTGAVLVTGNINVTGAVVKSAAVWHTPSYGTNWASGATSGTVQGLQYRLDGQDNLIIVGTMRTTTSSPASVAFVLPVGFRPLVYQRCPAVKNVVGVYSAVSFEVSSNGNVLVSPLPTATSSDINVHVCVPMGNIT